MLDSQLIRDAFRRLDEVLVDRGIAGATALVVGGAAIPAAVPAAGRDVRCRCFLRSTRDPFGDQQVAEELDLQPDWLNDGGKGLSSWRRSRRRGTGDTGCDGAIEQEGEPGPRALRVTPPTVWRSTHKVRRNLPDRSRFRRPHLRPGRPALCLDATVYRRFREFLLYDIHPITAI